MATITSYKEYLQEAKNVRTLKKWYSDFNRKHFGNKLPDITIKLETMSFNRFGHVVVNGDGSIARLALSTVIFNNFPDEIAQDVLMHEMIHVALVASGTIETSGGDKMHGKEFKDLLSKIEKSYGREIPSVEALQWVEKRMKELGYDS